MTSVIFPPTSGSGNKITTRSLCSFFTNVQCAVYIWTLVVCTRKHHGLGTKTNMQCACGTDHSIGTKNSNRPADLNQLLCELARSSRMLGVRHLGQSRYVIIRKLCIAKCIWRIVIVGKMCVTFKTQGCVVVYVNPAYIWQVTHDSRGVLWCVIQFTSALVWRYL